MGYKMKMPHLQKYLTPEAKKKYRYSPFIPISKEDRWKALVITMHEGEWLKIRDIQRATGFRRKRVRNLLRDAMAIGVVEKSPYIYTRIRKKFNRWGEPLQENIQLYKKEAKYRMDMSQIIITEENPSE